MVTLPGTVAKCASSIGLDWIIGEVIDTHRRLCWKQVDPSVPGGDFSKLPMLIKRPLPLTNSADSDQTEGAV